MFSGATEKPGTKNRAIVYLLEYIKRAEEPKSHSCFCTEWSEHSTSMSLSKILFFSKWNVVFLVWKCYFYISKIKIIPYHGKKQQQWIPFLNKLRGRGHSVYWGNFVLQVCIIIYLMCSFDEFWTLLFSVSSSSDPHGKLHLPKSQIRGTNCS